MQVETIKIKDDNRRGFKTINKSDFDEKVHKVYTVSSAKRTRSKKVSNDNN